MSDIEKKYFELIKYVNDCLTVDLEELVIVERDMDNLFIAGLDIPVNLIDKHKLLVSRVNCFAEIDSKFGF